MNNFSLNVHHPCHPHLVANKSSTKLMTHNCILHQGSVQIGRLVKQLKLSDRLWFWGVGHAVSAVESWARNRFEHRFGWDSWNAWIKDSFTRRLCLYLQLHVRMYPWSFLLSFGLMPVLSLEVCRLDVYIYDYLVKRNLQASAKAFLNECKLVCFILPPALWRWLFSHNKIMLMAFCLTTASCWGWCCSYWCTLWFSVWMAVSLLRYPCRLYQWGAFRSGSFLYWGEFWCSNFGGISYNPTSNGFYNLCKLAQKQSF